MIYIHIDVETFIFYQVDVNPATQSGTPFGGGFGTSTTTVSSVPFQFSTAPMTTFSSFSSPSVSTASSFTFGSNLTAAPSKKL